MGRGNIYPPPPAFELVSTVSSPDISILNLTLNQRNSSRANGVIFHTGFSLRRVRITKTHPGEAIRVQETE